MSMTYHRVLLLVICCDSKFRYHTHDLVELGLEDHLHVNDTNNEIPAKFASELNTVNPCNDNTTINLSNNQEQEARSTNIEKVGMNLTHDLCDS